ncbi:MAG: hypothetical protein KAG66_17340, partial [Methylococcales bacterium]|nr:hypothetical protein [Methylococcales bacterium]
MLRIKSKLHVIGLMVVVGLMVGVLVSLMDNEARVEAFEVSTQPVAVEAEVVVVDMPVEALAVPPAKPLLMSDPTIHLLWDSYGSDAVTFSISATHMVDLSAFEFDVVSRQPVAVADTGVQGSVLTDTGRTVGLVGPDIDFDQTRVELGAYSYGEPAGCNGATSLGTATFSLSGEGATIMDLENWLLVQTNADILTPTSGTASLSLMR